MKTVVIVGGLGMGERCYREVSATFEASGWRVLVPPLWVDERLPYADWLIRRAEMLRDYLRRERINAFILLAESSGGLPVMTYARLYPEALPVAIYLTNAVSLPRGKSSLSYILGLLSNWAQLVTSARRLSYGLRCLTDILTNAARHPRHVWQEIKINNEVDQMAYADDVPVKTTVLWGKSEQMLPTQYAHKLADRLPSGELVFVDGGHIWIHGRPELLLSIIQERHAND